MLVLTSQKPKAVAILLAGGHGGLQIAANGVLGWGKGNFLVRTRRKFADQDLLVVVVERAVRSPTPAVPLRLSWHQRARHGPQGGHRLGEKQADVPVWLIGTSRGTESTAYAATYLTGHDGPDGIVLTSTILTDSKEFSVPPCNW